MIDIQDKSQCCGCGACGLRCPQSCIEMREDIQGFLYPHVDEDRCVDCHLCEQVCSCMKTGNAPARQTYYAAINPDEATRLSSSSGGVFTLLAERIISQGGVVFGACFNDQNEVIHDCVEIIADLELFRGSKYVQSVIGVSYRKVEDFLAQGRLVLFSGTPCQIAGLKHYLLKPYSHLITVEVACHGVPSPAVWRQYLKMRSPKASCKKISFRDKSTGWSNYSIKIESYIRPHDEDDYMLCFLKDYSLRPSCFSCSYKGGKSGADITMADFWGVQEAAPRLHDEKGVSLIIVNSLAGQSLIDQVELNKHEVKPDIARAYNPALYSSAFRPERYDRFWKQFSRRPVWTIRRYGSLNFNSIILKFKQVIKKHCIDMKH